MNYRCVLAGIAAIVVSMGVPGGQLVAEEDSVEIAGSPIYDAGDYKIYQGEPYRYSRYRHFVRVSGVGGETFTTASGFKLRKTDAAPGVWQITNSEHADATEPALEKVLDDLLNNPDVIYAFPVYDASNGTGVVLIGRQVLVKPNNPHDLSPVRVLLREYGLTIIEEPESGRGYFHASIDDPKMADPFALTRALYREPLIEWASYKTRGKVQLGYSPPQTELIFPIEDISALSPEQMEPIGTKQSAEASSVLTIETATDGSQDLPREVTLDRSSDLSSWNSTLKIRIFEDRIELLPMNQNKKGQTFYRLRE